MSLDFAFWDAIRSIELFGKEVIPAFAAAPVAAS
jgi:hypothetical protein